MNNLFLLQIYNKKKNNWNWIEEGKYHKDEPKKMTSSQKLSFFNDLKPFNGVCEALKTLSYFCPYSSSGVHSLATDLQIEAKSLEEFTFRIIDILNDCTVEMQLNVNDTPHKILLLKKFDVELAQKFDISVNSEYEKSLFEFSCKKAQKIEYLFNETHTLIKYKERVSSLTLLG